MTENTEIVNETDAPEEVAGASVAEAPVAPVEPEPTPDPALEAEARKYGWKPKDEFTLTPERWRDAKTFLESAPTQVKMLKDELKVRDARIAAAEQIAREAAATVRAEAQRRYEVERQRFEAEIADLRAAKLRAAEGADIETYKTLEQREASIRLPEQPRLPAAPQPAYDPLVKEYIDKNEWTKDQALLNWARIQIDQTPAVQAMPAIDQVMWAERRVKEFFPHRFPAPAPVVPAPAPVAAPVPAPVAAAPRVSRVDGGGLATAAAKPTLSAEERQAAMQYVKKGVFKSVDEYAAYRAQLYGE